MGVWAPPATAARTSGKDNIADLINAQCIEIAVLTWEVKRMKPGVITSLLGVVSGTEATQYGIKVFNPQERFCYTGWREFRIYKRGVNPVNLVNPEILSKTE